MRRGLRLGLLAGLLAGSSAWAGGAPASHGPRLEAVTLGIQHRIFHDFHDVQRVKLNQEFLLGDSDYSARVVQYVPDFEMDLGTRKVISRSDQPNNPAFKIIVREKKVPQDTTWAFLNMPPHFGRRSFFAFHVLRIDFAGRAPLVADTTSEGPAAPRPPSPPPSGAGGPHAPTAAPADTSGRR